MSKYSVVDFVTRHQEGVLIQNILQDDRFADVTDRKLEHREIICAPIKIRNEVRGVIYADRSIEPLKKRRYSESDI